MDFSEAFDAIEELDSKEFVVFVLLEEDFELANFFMQLIRVCLEDSLALLDRLLL